MKTRTKILIGTLVVAGLGGVIAVSRMRAGRDATEVEAEKVARQGVTSIVEASGQIEPKVSVDISSDVIGRIVAVGVEEGDLVRRGQFLVQVDPTQFEQRSARSRAELEAMRTALDEATANLGLRRADFERDQRLFNQQLLPRSRYEASESAVQVGEAQVASARNRIRQSEAVLEETRDQLSRCRLVAPMDGIVIRKNADVGETAISGTLNNAGSLLMTVADLSVMKVEVDVDETDVVDVALGQPTEISIDAFPARKFKGEVTRIGNSAVQTAAAPGQRQSADYKVEVTLLETEPRVRPGLSATARITTATRTDVLTVPIQALVLRAPEKDKADKKDGKAGEAKAAQEPGAGAGVERASATTGSDPAAATAEKKPSEGTARDEELEGVFAVRDGKAVFTPVRTGIAGEKHFEVLEGLAEGDEVVTGNFAALRKLKNGDPVNVKKTDSKKKKSSPDTRES